MKTNLESILHAKNSRSCYLPLHWIIWILNMIKFLTNIFLSFLQLVILIYWISRYTYTNDFQFKANMYRMYWKKIDFDYQGSWSVIYGESCVVLFSCICFIFQTSKWDGKWNLFSQRCLRIFIIPLPKCTFSGPWTR